MSMKEVIISIMLEKLEESSGKALDEKATNPYAIGMAAAMKSTGDEPPLKKSTIMKAHKIAKSIEKNEEVEIDEAMEYSTWHVQHPTKPTQNYKVKARTSGEAIKKAHKAAIDAGHMKSNVPNTVFQAKHIQKVNEEVEQIDEISQEKLRDYHAKAGTDRLKAKATVQKVLNTKKPAMSSIDKASSAYKRFQKRGAGMTMAANKMDEETELDEAVNAKKIIADHDAGHSIDVIVQKHLNKKADNKDEILKVIRNNAWNKRIKK